ncbi:hypothetical protein HX017_01770 [Myroides marinus]|uniref:hypothetical protein n=1 Tax=Myroides marinus TaxID=703342 RepID=UPI0007AAE484|nr:hypothetical protein [Myroides marinus]MDM1345850.1 hypothetical protein [Myroides marinus]MDM1349289.1 hypothetical protein [Myroides marinus]MDM1353033.1 hypothetical protein [Myroides marinus]MDM1356499.1 hypothetical protein [Myroides marinus]MDM1360859.1 hypothetical protein [Myroides marinus]
MCTRLSILVLLASVSMYGQVVRDTIWMNDYDAVVSKREATNFKIIKQDPKDTLKVHLGLYDKKTKQLKTSGYGLLDETGTQLTLKKASIYNTDGVLKFTNTFDTNDNIDKIYSTDARTGEQYECQFLDNNPYNGKFFFLENGKYIYMEVINGQNITSALINPNNLNNRIEFKSIDKDKTSEEYYDESGKLLYTTILKNNNYYNGTRVDLFKKQFKIKSIENRTEGQVNNITQYYTTGEIKTKASKEGDKYTQIFYNKEGEIIGQQSFIQFWDRVIEKEGTMYSYSAEENEDDITITSYYEKDKLVRIDSYYTSPNKNTIETSTYLKKGADFGFDKIEYFNKEGILHGVATFDEKGLNVLNGTDYKKGNKTVTKDGLIVEKTIYYSNGNIFQFTKDLVSTFYDTKGKEIGKVTLNKTEDPDKLYNTGTVFTMEDDLIIQMSTYKDGLTLTDKVYNIDNEISQLAIEVIYKKGNPYITTLYYTNGKKAIEYIYGMKDYSTLAKGTFYKDTGELIGTYDYIYETGTLVKYTDNLEIVSIETTQDGQPLTKKEFGIYGEDKILTEPSYYVYAYTDYNKSGETYDETGEVLSFTEYREGKPYEGLVYNFDTENNLATETSYKEGKKVDKETIRNTETNETISVNFYEEGELIKVATYNEGILFKIAEYKNGELEGTTSFFSPDNKLTSTVSFNNNLPIEGTYIYKQENYLVKTTFKDKSRITKQIYYIDPTSGYETLVMLEKYIDNNTINRSVYDQTTGKLIYDYSVKENVLDGLFKHYEADRLKHQATFKNGKISGGTVAIIDFNFDPITDSHEDYPNHTVITKSKNTYHITIEDEAKKELLNMQIKETVGDNSYNALFNTPLLIENLYPYNQLNNTPSEWKTYAPIKAGDLKPNILDSLF